MVRLIGGEYTHTNDNLLYIKRQLKTARNKIIAQTQLFNNKLKEDFQGRNLSSRAFKLHVQYTSETSLYVTIPYRYVSNFSS